MAQIITNYAAKKLLGSQLEKYKHKAVGGDDDVRLLLPDPLQALLFEQPSTSSHPALTTNHLSHSRTSPH